MHFDSDMPDSQLQQEREKAGSFQRHLLPEPLSHADYQLDWGWQPAQATSGDWLDYWWTADGKLLFWLADVSGHDLSSALLSVWLSGWHGRYDCPMALLTAINQRLIQLESSRHLTALAGLLNPQTHELSWISAGHYPPPLLYSQSQSDAPAPMQVLPGEPGMALGWVDSLPRWQTQQLQLQPGDTFCFFSDGLLEQFTGQLAQRLTRLGEQFLASIQSGLPFMMPAPDQVLSDDVSWLTLARRGIQ